MKNFIMNSTNIERDSYVWNMIGSMLMAFQSVIMLMMLTRTVGLVEAGIFTIAYANANLFLTIGKYGMRNFQVSDVKKQFSFAEYRISRIITVIAMVLIIVSYIFYTASTKNYSMEKSMVIFWMCMFKVVDVVEDLFHGLYQKNGRLDIAAKIMAVRMCFTIIVFGVGVSVFKNQLTAIIITTIFTMTLSILFLCWTFEPFSETEKNFSKRKILDLLKSCFPLFAGSFLSFYIGNAPKYAIDSLLSDEVQACYGFIAMPVFVIGLLNSFIFNPRLFKMSCMWSEGKIREFLKATLVQITIIVGITITCIVGAFIMGIPVLSFLYNTDLNPYKRELIILLVGGGFLGLSGLMGAVITIVRFHKSLAWGYAVVATIAYLLSDVIVYKYEMLGAAILYTALMGGLCVCFLILFIVGVLLKRKTK